MTYRVFRSRRVMLPDGERGADVIVSEGRIQAIVAWGDAADDVVDLGDLVLLPGLVDTHVHVNEPGRTEWEGFDSATRAAAAGGITTLIDMPLNSIPPTTTVAHLAVKRDAARGSVHIDVGFWGGAIGSNTADLKALHEAGVFGFKSFLSPSGVDEFPHLVGNELDEVLAEVARLGALSIVHAEDPAVLDLAPPATDGCTRTISPRAPTALKWRRSRGCWRRCDAAAPVRTCCTCLAVMCCRCLPPQSARACQ